MAIHYMDDGFGPHADRGFDAASAHLESNGLHLEPGGDTEQHSRELVKHTLSLNLNASRPSPPNSSPKPSPSQAPPAKPTAKDPSPRPGPRATGRC